MKRATILLATFLFMLSLSPELLGQDEIVYRHPELGIQFTASPNWTKVSRLDDRTGYEFVNLNNNMNVRMWYSVTEIPVLEYLRSTICKEGRVSPDGPFSLVIDNREAYGISANCTEMRKPFQVMLIALPTADGMYLLRIKCPEDCYTEHKKQIDELLGSISLGMVVERSLFYASIY